jgi:hypothetical protein
MKLSLNLLKEIKQVIEKSSTNNEDFGTKCSNGLKNAKTEEEERRYKALLCANGIHECQIEGKLELIDLIICFQNEDREIIVHRNLKKYYNSVHKSYTPSYKEERKINFLYEILLNQIKKKVNYYKKYVRYKADELLIFKYNFLINRLVKSQKQIEKWLY